MGRKSSIITLTAKDRAYLETQTKAHTIQAQTVARARILLLKADGCSIDMIADKLDMNRKSVMLCLNKYAEGGIENALFDASGRGRNAEITDDEKPGIQAIATTSDDLPPDKNHSTLSRDYEYKQLGTISLLAGIDLQTAETIPLIAKPIKVGNSSQDYPRFLHDSMWSGICFEKSLFLDYVIIHDATESMCPVCGKCLGG